jgi:hypothetical protein
VEELLAEVPEVFRCGAYGAEPGAKGFLEEEARDEEDDEEKHRRGVDGGDVVGGEEVFEVHEAGDGEPAFDAGGAGDVMGLTVGFEVTDPEIELEAEPGVEGQESDLDGVADALGVVEEMAADEGLFGGGERSGGGHGYLLLLTVASGGEWRYDLGHKAGDGRPMIGRAGLAWFLERCCLW